MTTSYQKDQQKYCKIAEFRNRLTGISMLISVFKNHENSSPSVVLLTGYSGDLSVNSIKRGTYLTNVYYQKKREQNHCLCKIISIRVYQYIVHWHEWGAQSKP